jgi:hypothetical protein
MSKLYVLCDHKMIPRLNQRNYFHYNIVHYDGTPCTILSAKQPGYLKEIVRRQQRLDSHVSEIGVDDLVFYSTMTKCSVKIIENMYCDLETRKEICEAINMWDKGLP